MTNHIRLISSRKLHRILRLDFCSLKWVKKDGIDLILLFEVHGTSPFHHELYSLIKTLKFTELTLILEVVIYIINLRFYFFRVTLMRWRRKLWLMSTFAKSLNCPSIWTFMQWEMLSDRRNFLLFTRYIRILLLLIYLSPFDRPLNILLRECFVALRICVSWRLRLS